MLLRGFLPSPALREYIENIGIVHLVFAPNEPIPVKAYTPKTGDSIEFFLRDPEYVQYPGETNKTKRPEAFIHGQHTLVTNRHVGQEFLYLNIKFQPGVLFRLTGIPAYELTNTYIDAEAVFSPDIRTLTEQLKNANSYAEMLERVESFVVRLIRRSIKNAHGIDKVAKLLLHNTQSISMDWPGLDWLASQSCLCPRQFERKFRERMGIPASLLARVARFDKAFQLKNAHPDKDWLSIALLCGYYDYQHLAKDYKDFTGLTPIDFHRLEAQSPEKQLGLTDRLYQERIDLRF
ncbi:helix-turn-helix domain-containing protein [Spirosoma endbachense]|uniref:Helix-turn-helix domain-containing protein n=1 Tax=Spirosoma endbachense TaxID=2666025 RepID=A0A6P1W8Q2_9BACT|nr:helix-turn-helix domain-containing protein [Spirosoma endbachense]QHW00291.1 helix-turn-helix domain-containing protein [Spirosoma endbachense]